PFPPRSWNAKVPPWLQEIILRCLAIEPAERYATAAQLAFDLQHPDQVTLTARAARTSRAGFLTVALRRLRTHQRAPVRRRSVSGLLARAPIIMVALDLAPENVGLREAIAVAVRRVLATEPAARLACVNVLKSSLMALDPETDVQGRNPHLRRLIELKHWT